MNAPLRDVGVVESRSLRQKLSYIQNHLRVGKDKFNTFGNYKYRSASDIMEALKPLLQEVEALCFLSHETFFSPDGNLYLRCKVLFEDDSGEHIESFAPVRVSSIKKGMDDGQIFGASMSYASKYALQSLFLLDDGVDNDFLDDRERQRTGHDAQHALQGTYEPGGKKRLSEQDASEVKKTLFHMLTREGLSRDEIKDFFAHMVGPDRGAMKVAIINLQSKITEWRAMHDHQQSVG